MIVDIGGGTTDAAVISLGGIVASASLKCAGDKINQAIADYIKKNFNLFIGDRTAEDIKIKIGSAVLVDEEMVYKIKGRDFLTGLPSGMEITTNEVVKAIDSELKDMMKVIKNVLQRNSSGTFLRHHRQRHYAHRRFVAFEKFGRACFPLHRCKGPSGRRCPCSASPRAPGLALDHLDTYKKALSPRGSFMHPILKAHIEKREFHHAYLLCGDGEACKNRLLKRLMPY